MSIGQIIEPKGYMPIANSTVSITVCIMMQNNFIRIVAFNQIDYVCPSIAKIGPKT